MSSTLYPALTSAPDEGAPLVFAFHGTGGDEHQFFALAKDLVPGAGIVSPRGDVSEGGAARFFRRTGEGVYDMEDLAARTAKMIQFIEAQRALTPNAPLYGFGYSNGANILASVAFKRPDLFDRLGLLHPLIPWTPEPTQALTGKEVLITAGQHDPICPWPLSQSLIAWFRSQGAHVTTEVHSGGHEVRPAEIAALRTLFAQHATSGDAVPVPGA